MSNFFSRQNVFKLFAESFLIILSVLLALLLNEYRMNLREQKLKDAALTSVRNELRDNLATLEKWRPYHIEVLQNVQAAIQNPAIQDSMVSPHHINYWYIMPKGVVQSIINSTAWEILKGVNARTHIDFDTMLTLSNLYNIQAMGVQATVDVILQTMSSREALQAERLQETLMLFRSSYRELVSQEEYLIQTYKAYLENQP